jgi:5-(aminomethyl)-3-furanmethanol phosphate kinase
VSERASSALILKLGGSLADGEHLRSWLQLAVDHADRFLVIVPGGGPFAEEVRKAQRKLGFTDGTAHRMALLAMEQYAIAMAGMEPRLCMASSPITIERALIRKQPVAWRPSAMALGRPDLPESWDLTSDSLACWLAEELCARGLVLVKSAAPPGNDRSAEALAEAGYVDPAFPTFRKRFRGSVACISAADHATAAAALAAGRDFGIPIEPA